MKKIIATPFFCQILASPLQPPLNFAEFGAPVHRHPRTFLYRGGESPREPPHNNRKGPTKGEKCPHYGKIVAKWTPYIVNKICGDFLRPTLEPAPSEGAHDRMQGLKLMFNHEGDNFESMRC